MQLSPDPTFVSKRNACQISTRSSNLIFLPCDGTTHIIFIDLFDSSVVPLMQNG
jgi:hypothetical protein